MEFIGNFLAVLVIAILISSAFFYALKARGPWGSFWTYFLILFLIIWAASLWVRPIGPAFYGIAWIPLFFAGLVFAILLAAIPPSHPHQNPPIHKPEKKSESAKSSRKKAESTTRSLAIVSGVFWILIIILMIVIIFGYMT